MNIYVLFGKTLTTYTAAQIYHLNHTEENTKEIMTDCCQRNTNLNCMHQRRYMVLEHYFSVDIHFVRMWGYLPLLLVVTST